MKIVIDQDRSMGHGQCDLVAAEFDEQRVVHLRTDHVDEALCGKAEVAARRCLEAAIQILH